MKDSGIEWIGMIPNEWDTSRVKYLATEKDSLFIDGDWIESDVIVESGIRYLTTGNVGPGYYKEQGSGYISEETFKKLNCLKVLPNDLMISRLNEPIGRACIVPNTEPYYVVAVDNVILRPDSKYDKKYIMYCMNTDGYAEAGKEAARGATMQRVSRTLLGSFFVPIAPLSEQKLITDFLDEKVKQINDILSDLNKQVEVLNMYRKSLITEAVTKGLNPDAKMKSSGINWIGDIPTGWHIKPIKYFADFYNGDRGENYPLNSELVNEGIPFINAGDIVNGIISYENMSYITKEKYKLMGGVKLKDNDMVYCLRGSIGKNALVHIDEGTVNSCMVGIRCKDYNPQYFYYCMNSFIEENWRNILSSGSVQAQMGAETIKLFKFPVPKITEQQEIVNYLDQKCAEIDSVIADKQKQIEKIEKYKKSLIYEYVTGKKRVRGGLIDKK